MGIGVWHKFGLTGGGATNLDGIAIAEIADGDVCHVYASGKYYYMVFDADANDAENSPFVIRPDDYSTAGVWKLASSPYGDLAVLKAIVSGLANNDSIDGGDVTVSGNTLTITPASCLDSGRTTQLYTSANQTCVIPSAANTDYYVFLVKLTVGGTFEFRAYTTLAGVASDGDVSKYRFITWCQTNGSSVVRPFAQTYKSYDFLGDDMPTITASLTTSYASYTISTIVPVTIFSELWILPTTSGQQLFVSYDGTVCISGISGVTGYVNPPAKIRPVAAIYMKYNNNNGAVKIRSMRIRR